MKFCTGFRVMPDIMMICSPTFVFTGRNLLLNSVDQNYLDTAETTLRKLILKHDVTALQQTSHHLKGSLKLCRVIQPKLCRWV